MSCTTNNVLLCLGIVILFLLLTIAVKPSNNIYSRWLCYSWYTPGPAGSGNACPAPAFFPTCANDYQIWYCAWPYNSNDSTPGEIRGAKNCNTSHNPKFLGMAYAFIGGVKYDPKKGFSLTLQNCLNNSLPSCPANSDPVNNPQVTLSGNVYPAQQSAQQN